MKTLKIISAISLIVLFFDASAQSDNSFEVDVGYTRMNYKETFGPNFPIDHLKFSISDNNIEALVSFGVDSSTKQYGELTYTISTPVIYGIFYKPEFNVGYGINLFAKVGLTRVNRKVTNPSSTNDTYTGLGYGVGANFLSTKWSKLNFEYTDYLNRNGIRAGGFSITNSLTFAY
jgi:hypothetical protein